MAIYLRILKLMGVVLGSTLLVNGCHIGYSFQGPGYDSDKGAVINQTESQVLLAITHGVIEDQGSSDFSKSLQRVRENLSTTEGLIGYSVRKEVFGNEVWTMSAWSSKEALEKFLEGKAHRSAVANGGIPPANVKSTYTWISAESLPISWDDAQLLLEKYQ